MKEWDGIGMRRRERRGGGGFRDICNVCVHKIRHDRNLVMTFFFLRKEEHEVRNY